MQHTHESRSLELKRIIKRLHKSKLDLYVHLQQTDIGWSVDNTSALGHPTAEGWKCDSPNTLRHERDLARSGVTCKSDELGRSGVGRSVNTGTRASSPCAAGCQPGSVLGNGQENR